MISILLIHLLMKMPIKKYIILKKVKVGCKTRQYIRNFKSQPHHMKCTKIMKSQNNCGKKTNILKKNLSYLIKKISLHKCNYSEKISVVKGKFQTKNFKIHKKRNRKI